MRKNTQETANRLVQQSKSRARKIIYLPLLSIACISSTQAETAQLEAIVVEGQPGVVTEGTDAYTSGRATVGFKHPVDIQEIPLTVNVITEQRLLDANIKSIENAAYLIPNVTPTLGNDFSGSLYSRGYEVFSYNVDGAPRPYLSLYGTAPDMVFFDRIEVLSGPSGIFQGSGEPVGTINLVRKRAAYDYSVEANAEYGSFDSRRVDVDVTGSLDEEGKVRGRFISYGMNQDSYVDISERERYGGYGTLEFDAGDSTTLSLGILAEYQNLTAMSGQPRFNDGSALRIDRDSFIGAPWNKNNYDTRDMFVELEHQFDSEAVLKIAARVYNRETDIKTAIATTGVNPNTGNFSMMTFARDWAEKTHYLDANYTLPSVVFGKNIELTVGADVRSSKQVFKQNFDFGLGVQNISSFDPYALVEPDISFPGVGPGFRLNTITDIREKGLYGFGRIELSERFKLSLGGRLSDYHSDATDTGRLRVTSIDEKEFIPFAGLSFDLTDTLTAYSSYSEIFQPQSETRSDGSQLQPVIGSQIEVGLKLSMLNGKLNGQASVYSLDDENRATTDPANNLFSVESGVLNTRGFEANISGQLTKNIDLFAGYSYVDTELTTDPTPEHSFNAFAKYSFHEGALNGLSTGLGVSAASSFKAQDSANNVTINAASYSILNALLAYRVNENTRLQLNVNNLLDEDYIVRVIDITRGTFYGEPLNATFTVNVKFD